MFLCLNAIFLVHSGAFYVMTLMSSRPVLKQHNSAQAQCPSLDRFLASSKVQECVGHSYVHNFSCTQYEKASSSEAPCDTMRLVVCLAFVS